MSNNYDYLFKIILIGDSGVGKSSLLQRYTDDVFTNVYSSTIGVDFRMKTIKFNGKIIKLQIWDTAGQERFRAIIGSYYRGADGIIICYDTTNYNSFNNVKLWLNEIEKYYNNNDITKVIFGTKNDIKNNHIVNDESLNSLANATNIKIYQTSAKNNNGVDFAFNHLISDLIEKHDLASKIKYNQNKNITVCTNDVKIKRKFCCNL